MSKALPPIGRRQSNSTRRSSVNKMSTYPPKEGSRRTSQARSMGNTARSVSPTATQVPSLPPVDFNLGPMQERVLPSYNDLEDPHLNLYWRRQQYLVYEREEKKRQQRKLEEREARQQEAARRRFKERRQQELLGLSQKKGRPCSSCRNGTHTEASHQPAKPKRKSSTKPANKRPNTYKRPSDAAKAVSPKKEEEPPLSETDSTVGDDIWADRERYLGEEINGISIHYLPLDDNKAFLELEEERRRLRALDKVSYAGVIDDLEKRMKEIATALAEKEKKTAERKLYLDPFPEGILLEEVPLDDDEAFTKMEAERAELLKDGKDTKEIEQKLNDRCHEIAYDMKWKDREGYLGTSLENVAVRELPLDKNSGFLRVEEERKDLLKEEKSPAGDKIISEMENRLKQLATEEAKKKSDQWRELDVEKEESLRRLSAHEEEEQKRLAAEYAKSPNKSDQWRELDTEKEESLRRLSAHEEEEQKRLAAEYAKSPKRTLLSRDSIATSYGEDSDDSEEEWRELDEKPAKPLSAHFEKKPEVKDEYDDDDFEVEENTKPAAKDEDEWREIDDEDEDEKAKSPVKPLHSTEEKKVEKDEYDDDDFEDELDVTPKKDASRDLPKADEWKELDEEDVKPLTANFEKAPKKLSAHFEKKPVQPIVATEEKVNDWREISEDDIDEDEKAKTPVKPLHSTEEKKVEKDEYDDDDFEDELDVTPKKEANASRDLPKADEWKELDEEDVKPLTANFEKAPKKLSAHFEKKPVQPIVATEEKVNDWREISEDDVADEVEEKSPVKPLVATEENKKETDDDEYRELDDDVEEKSPVKKLVATEEKKDDEVEDEIDEKSPVKPLHSTEEKKDEYDDDEFEDELDVTPKKNASRDLPKAGEWKELDEDDVKSTSAAEKNEESVPEMTATLERQEEAAMSETPKSARTETDDDEYRELDDEVEEKSPVKKLVATEEKKDDEVEDEIEDEKASLSEDNSPKATREVVVKKAEDEDDWRELDDEVEDKAAAKKTPSVTEDEVSEKKDDDDEYDDDFEDEKKTEEDDEDDWGEL